MNQLLAKGQEMKDKQNIASHIREAQQEVKRLTESLKLYEDLLKNSNDEYLNSNNNVIKTTNELEKAKEILNKYVSLQKQQEEEERIANMSLNERKAYYEEEVNYIRQLIDQKNGIIDKNEKITAQASIMARGFANMNVNQLKSQLQDVLGMVASVNNAIGVTNKSAGEKNKSDWETQRKNAQERLDSMTGNQINSKEWKEQKELILQAESELKKYNISLSSTTKGVKKHDSAIHKAQKRAENLANKRKDIIKEIDEAERNYANSRLKENDREIASIDEKYKRLKDKAKEFKLPEEQVKRIDDLLFSEKSSTRYKQETEAIFKKLSEQKEIFASYEVLKTKIGAEEADKRYSKELSTYQSYLSLLDDEINKLKAVKKLSPEQSERKERLEREKSDFLKDGNKDNEQKFAELYSNILSFNEKRKALEAQYQKDKATLEKISNEEIRTAKLQELEFQKNASLDAINAEAYEREASAGKLSESLLGITKRELATRIASLEEYLATAKDVLTEEQMAYIKAELEKAKAIKASTDIGVEEKALLQEKERIIKRIQDLQSKGITNVSDEAKQLEDVNSKLRNILSKKFAKVSEVAGQLGGAFTELGSSLKSYDEDLGDTVETMGEMLNITSDVTGAIASFSSGDNIVGGITKKLKTISGIFQLGAKSRESERKAQQEIKEYNDKIFQSQLDYNTELRKRIVEETKLNDIYKSRVTNIQEEIEARKKNAEQIKIESEKVFKKLMSAQTTVGMGTEKYGGFLGFFQKTRAVEIKKV